MNPETGAVQRLRVTRHAPRKWYPTAVLPRAKTACKTAAVTCWLVGLNGTRPGNRTRYPRLIRPMPLPVGLTRKKWSGIQESNLSRLLGRQLRSRYVNPANGAPGGTRIRFPWIRITDITIYASRTRSRYTESNRVIRLTRPAHHQLCFSGKGAGSRVRADASLLTMQGLSLSYTSGGASSGSRTHTVGLASQPTTTRLLPADSSAPRDLPNRTALGPLAAPLLICAHKALRKMVDPEGFAVQSGARLPIATRLLPTKGSSGD